VVLDYQGLVIENLVRDLVEGKVVVLHICLRDNLDIYLTGSLVQMRCFTTLVLDSRPVIHCTRELYVI
jgi:hypothetical protein